jgi:predicted nucleic acid-binding protein
LNALYLDTAAFIKVVVNEAESDALRAFLTDSPARRVSSALLRTEALRAVRYLGSDTLSVVREGLRRVELVGIDDRILDAAGILEPRVLRTLDAIHIATAMALGDDLEAVVTYDARLTEAAQLLGLRTATPR